MSYELFYCFIPRRNLCDEIQTKEHQRADMPTSEKRRGRQLLPRTPRTTGSCWWSFHFHRTVLRSRAFLRLLSKSALACLSRVPDLKRAIFFFRSTNGSTKNSANRKLTLAFCEAVSAPPFLIIPLRTRHPQISHDMYSLYLGIPCSPYKVLHIGNRPFCCDTLPA